MIEHIVRIHVQLLTLIVNLIMMIYLNSPSGAIEENRFLIIV